MSVHYRKDFAIGTSSKTIFLTNGKSVGEALLSPEDYTRTIPGDDEAQYNVALWGANNLKPQELARDIKSTGVLSSGIDTKARILIGRGPTAARITSFDKNGYEELEFVNEPQVTGFLTAHNAFMQSFEISKDLFSYGNAFVQILLSRDRKKIVGFKRIDANQCRFSKMNPDTGKIEYVYVSADWSRWMNPDNQDTKHLQAIPLLDRDYPLLDLQERTEGCSFMIAIQYGLHGSSYYACAPWEAARKWAKIAQGIPEMKAAMFNNQITLKYIVEIHPQFWEAFDPTYAASNDDQKKGIQDRFYESVDELLVGGENAYKSLFSTTVTDRQTNQVVPGLKITAIDDKVKDGKLLPDSGAANSELLFALSINPSLMGADMPGGAYSGGAGSGSNIREAFLVQIMLGEGERQMNNRVYSLIFTYNGYDPMIVTRYPNQILTTLNQGGNTQTTA